MQVNRIGKNSTASLWTSGSFIPMSETTTLKMPLYYCEGGELKGFIGMDVARFLCWKSGKIVAEMDLAKCFGIGLMPNIRCVGETIRN